jgi:hypothetical protein
MDGGMFGGDVQMSQGGMMPKALKHDNPRKALKDAMESQNMMGAQLHGVSMWMAQEIDRQGDMLDALEARVVALEKGKDGNDGK